MSLQLSLLELTMKDENPEYLEFVEKFKPKKTTDDCYTPPEVYDAIADWVACEYGLDRENFVRPFYPGGDFQRYEYPEGCVVVDNPPFSILAQIKRWYLQRGIRFFLFAPALTCFSGGLPGVCHILASCNIEYENGAVVRTAFVTDLEPETALRTAPDLHRAVEDVIERLHGMKARHVPTYEYPDEVMTAARAGWLNEWGVEYRLPADGCMFIRALDAQRSKGKVIFGGGYLLSQSEAAKAARAAKAAKAAKAETTTTWELSDRERWVSERLQ